MKLKDISNQITQALDKILPENISCVFVLYDPQDKDVLSAANIPDEGAIMLLEEAADTLKNPDEETDDLKVN